MPTITKYADSYSDSAAVWATPTNAYADESTHAYATTATQWITRRSIWYYFSNCEVPIGATLNSVIITTEYKSSSTTAGVNVFLQGVYPNNTTLLDTEVTGGIAAPTTDTTLSTNNLNALLTVSNLNSGNVGARFAAYRSNYFTTGNCLLNFVRIVIDYTEAPETTLSVNIDGTYKNAIMSVNVDGAWKSVIAIKEKVEDAWV